jgi:hypothetical protein
MSKALRYLRIGWTVLFGLVAVLVGALWVRGYWIGDGFYSRVGQRFSFCYCALGTVQLTSFVGDDGDTRLFYMEHSTFLADEAPDLWFESNRQFANSGIDYVTGEHGDYWVIRCWFLALITIAAAAMPWLPLKRFSLRTLLIATTLIAVVLGLMMYAGKW